MLKKWLKGLVNEVISDGFAESRKQIHDEVASALHDITYRINVLKESAEGSHRINTSDLNIATHMLDGYVFNNNKPVAGSVEWVDLNITYKGITYTITNGNSAMKYIWWQFSATDKTKLQSTNTKPVLTQDDILIGINEGGIFTLTMAPGKMTPGGALLDGSVGSGELGNGAVTAGKIGSGAINNSNLFSGKVVTGGNMVDGTISSTQLGSGAVVAGKIAAGAVNNANLFTANVVDTNALKDGAVTSTQLGDNAVTSAKLNSGAVTAGKIASGAVNNSNIFASGVVDNTALKGGAVDETKFNVATHFLF
jgi:hypothetical protein